ncbi:hypothetical protein ACG7TL_008918 [Trametes sanguinea]
MISACDFALKASALWSEREPSQVLSLVSKSNDISTGTCSATLDPGAPANPDPGYSGDRAFDAHNRSHCHLRALRSGYDVLRSISRKHDLIHLLDSVLWHRTYSGSATLTTSARSSDPEGRSEARAPMYSQPIMPMRVESHQPER